MGKDLIKGIIQKLFSEQKGDTPCPYCHNYLLKFPLKKYQCPHCKKYIYVRTSSKTSEKLLTTEDDAKQIDDEWKNKTNTTRWFNTLRNNGITNTDIEGERKVLSKKFGKQVDDKDLIWGLFNKLTVRNKDFQKLKMVYYSMALFLNEEGRSSLQLLQQAARMELLDYKNQDFIKTVEILTCKNDSCLACQKFQGKRYSIEEALRDLPIPVKNCSHTFYENGKGFCRCLYQACVD